MSPPKNSAAPVEMRLRIDGHKIQVRTLGAGPPLLLVNGLGAHIAMWGRWSEPWPAASA